MFLGLFTVKLYHDGVFQVNPLEYVQFDNKVIDDVSFDVSTHALKLLETNENLCSFVKACYENNLKIDLSDSDVETNHPLDDVAHVVEQFEHEDECNVNILRMTTNDPWLKKTGRKWDVSEGKCAGLKSKKPKTIDDEECETSKQGSKKGDGRKAVNEILNKAVKERWDKKKECEKKGL
ncbi:hypothetical protein Tco_0232110 [Tanacetum coccineum]